jgi:hypothetical protein
MHRVFLGEILSVSVFLWLRMHCWLSFQLHFTHTNYGSAQIRNSQHRNERRTRTPIGDVDGVLVVSREAVGFTRAIEKARGEKFVQKAIQDEMSVCEAFATLGVM